MLAFAREQLDSHSACKKTFLLVRPAFQPASTRWLRGPMRKGSASPCAGFALLDAFPGVRGTSVCGMRGSECGERNSTVLNWGNATPIGQPAETHPDARNPCGKRAGCDYRKRVQKRESRAGAGGDRRKRVVNVRQNRPLGTAVGTAVEILGQNSLGYPHDCRA